MLSAPGSVVISQQHSIKYFGDANPINSIIYLNDSIPYTVTGVFNDLPRNTHFNFEVVMTTAGIDDIDRRFIPDDGVDDWIGANYIKVNEGVKLEDLQHKINDQRRDLYGHWANTDDSILVKSLKDIVFSDLVDNPFVYKSKNALNILLALSIIVLFLAWTNYVGLSITTLHKRMPEVGTRKVVGARNRDFIIQFFTESAIINLLSLLLAFTLVQLVKSPVEYFLHFYVADWKTIISEHFIIHGVDTSFRDDRDRYVSCFNVLEKKRYSPFEKIENGTDALVDKIYGHLPVCFSGCASHLDWCRLFPIKLYTQQKHRRQSGWDIGCGLPVESKRKLQP